jgi:hypothetical protein
MIRRESPVALLELKLQKWMVQQPEWLLIVNMPRQQRRAAMRELANRLYSIPIMDGVNTVPRQVRRKAAKKLAHAAVTGQITEQVREALEEVVLREAEATVALDHSEDAQTIAIEPSLDPEGDVKADLEAAKAAAVAQVQEELAAMDELRAAEAAGEEIEEDDPAMD